MAAHPLSADERYELIRSVGEECILENELRNLVEKKPNIRCYDGFEPSGRMHIAQGVYKSINVNKCTTAGCTFVFWVADWFALMNDKVGGELPKINTVGKYLIEVWKAAGMDMTKVIFLWASEEITSHADTYWRMVLDIGRRNTIARIKKCCTIMGKNEGTLTAAQMLYPLMQCADIFYLRADICQLGLDQRKVNMLAREYCDLTGKKLKPVILSHHMLAGLKQGQAKMSKSDPDSAIFMEDAPEDVHRKIMQAYCPRVTQQRAQITDDGAPVGLDDKNPILDYYECIIFSAPHAHVEINGVIYNTYKDLEAAFVNEHISENTLKETLVMHINALLAPVHSHFESNAEAHELLEKVKSYRNSTSSEVKEANKDDCNNIDNNNNNNNKNKAETATSSSTTKFTYTLPTQPHACVWLPALLRFPLNTAIVIIQSVQKFMYAHHNATVTLLLPDWTYTACNAMTGDEKDVSASLTYYAHLLTAYGLPSSVKIVKESELILSNSNKFWVTVINVGRSNTLSRIEEIHHGELQNAGQVVGSLMRVATAVLLNISHVIETPYDVHTNTMISEFTHQAIQLMSMQEPTFVIPPLTKPMQSSNGDNSNDSNITNTNTNNDDKNNVVNNYNCSYEMNKRGWITAMQTVKTAETIDEELYLDDNEMDVRRKIKKAYCAPNEKDNAVVSIASYFIYDNNKNNNKNNNKLTKPATDTTNNKPEEEINHVEHDKEPCKLFYVEHEGVSSNTSTYNSVELLEQDCVSGRTHPGDLKAAVTRELIARSGNVRALLAGAETKKMMQMLRNAEKKMLKKK